MGTDDERCGRCKDIPCPTKGDYTEIVLKKRSQLSFDNMRITMIPLWEKYRCFDRFKGKDVGNSVQR